MTLEQRFTLLLAGLDFSEGEIDLLWKDLKKYYSAKSRKYHNEEHLKQMFSFYDIYENHLQNPVEVSASIFYHDIIYSISSKENEEKSADFAMTVFKNRNVGSEIIKGLILATKMHDSKTEDEKWMVDFDLSILGQDWALYQIYSEKIRKEYRLYPNLIYNPGRKKVLLHFLEKDRIFQTQTFYGQFEKMARNNIETELNSL